MAGPAKLSEDYVQGLMQAGQSAVHQFTDALATMGKQNPAAPVPPFGLPESLAKAAEMQQGYLEQVQSFWKFTLGWQVGGELELLAKAAFVRHGSGPCGTRVRPLPANRAGSRPLCKGAND